LIKLRFYHLAFEFYSCLQVVFIVLAV